MKVTKEYIFNVLREEMPFLKQSFGVKRIALFGSFAAGDAGDNSDIDLVVEFEHLPGLRFIKLIDYLEDKLGKEVDILTPGGIAGIRLESVSRNIKESLIYV